MKIEKLCHLVGPQCVGIIWIMQKSTPIFSSTFYALDYLFDGLLAKQMRLKKNILDTNLFFNHQFGDPLFLIQERNSPQVVKKIEHCLELMSSFSKEKNIVVILKDESEKMDYAQQLTHLFKARFKFQEYSLPC